MYSLEISFADDPSEPETVFVQRPHAIIGASDYSHVVIGDLAQLPYELHLYRGVGRSFRTLPVASQAHQRVDMPDALDGQYDREATLDMGPLKIVVTALDFDLSAPKGEALDKSSARILRRACEKPAPYLPAVAVRGDYPVAVSFASDLPLLVGRDRECHLRLDAPDVSGKHASVSYENGEFWIEDLGSTNGTFVSGQQVSGKTKVPVGKPIVVGRSVVAYALDQEKDLNPPRDTSESDLQAIPQESYPMLVSLSEVVRPQRFVLPEGQTIRIGREPSSDMWLGAPHVSRKHCTIEFLDKDQITLTDFSMNGLAYDGGILTQGESVGLGQTPCVLNFGGGITVAVCFSAEHEQAFNDADGDATAFLESDATLDQSQLSVLATQPALEFNASEGTTSGKPRKRNDLKNRFLRLRLGQRIAVLCTFFFGMLAIVLVMKLVVPMFL